MWSIVAVMFCICLKWPEPTLSMPVHGHQKHGVLDSISHCNAEQRRLISLQLKQRFNSELPSSDMTLPPSQTSIQVLIYVTYNVFNTKITKFALESTDLASENGVPAWKISKATVKVEGGYKYSHTFSSDSGTYDLSMDHVKMYIIGNKCQIDLGQPNKVFSGSTANWGYANYIKGTSRDDDNKDLKEKLCHYTKRIFHEVLSRSTCLPPTTTTIAPSTHPVPGDDPESINEEHKPEDKKPESDQESNEKSSKESGGAPSTNVGNYNGDKIGPGSSSLKPHEVPSNQNPELTRVDDPFDEKDGKEEHISRPNLKPYQVTKSASHLEEEMFPNDEPLDIPGFLPHVDPKGDDKGKGLWSPSSASTHSTLSMVLSLSAFVALCIDRFYSCHT